VKLIIPKKENLIPIPFEYLDDTVDQYYRPIQGYFMRKRLELALKILDSKKVDKILDAGYGGGTFLPTLATLCNQVYGVDIHPFKDKVSQILKKEKVKANLIRGSITEIPYRDNYFDRVVVMSVLEHLKGKELQRAIKEILRVTRPGGFAVIGFPIKNLLTDLIIERVLKFNPLEIHPSGQKEIIPAVKKAGKINKSLTYPPFFPTDLSLYGVLKVVK